MKNRVLLTIIPALMILSACSGVAPKKEVNLFLEDNLAHEEIFGDADFVEGLGSKKPLRAAEDYDYEPQIGVQYRTYKKAYKGEDRDFCAIRYVAAITSTHVKAEWIRGVSMQDSTILKTKEAKESLVAYSALNNNGTILRAAEGTKFVVYSLYDIPLFEYLNEDPEPDMLNCNWSYVAAGLKLTDLDNNSNYSMSKIVAVEIGNHHCFAFNESVVAGDNDYFIEGRINGSDNQVICLDGDIGGSTNLAKKRMDFKANDNFGLFKWSETEFRFYGNFNCSYDHEYLIKDETLSTNYSRVGLNCEYTIYLNQYGQYGLSPEGSLPATSTLYLDASTWVVDNTAAFAVWQTSEKEWIVGANVSGNLYSFANVDISHDFLFVRYDKTKSPNWDWGGECQTDNIVYYVSSEFVLNNKFTITGWNNGGNGHAGFSRSVYTAA